MGTGTDTTQRLGRRVDRRSDHERRLAEDPPERVRELRLGTAQRFLTGRVLQLRLLAPGPCPADRSRQHLERGQPELLLETAVQSQRLERCARRLRGADGALLRRDQALAPVGPCHHLDLAARQRQPSRPLEHLPLREELHQGDGEGIPASHRRARIFDAWGQNVYGSTSKERPWARHRLDIGEGDYPRLLSYLRRAFGGTHQPVPGKKDVRIWYLENGFQTGVATKRSFYQDSETDRAVVAPVGPSSRPDQASQLSDAIRLAYCQPAVGGFFNFLLADESNLHGWQSGILFSDWTPKPSYQAFKRVIAEVNSRRVDCAKLKARIKKLGGSPDGL